MKLLKQIARYALILSFWFGIWTLVALAVGKKLLFPFPRAVFERLVELMGTKEFYFITANSLWNILLGILIATALGVSLSFVTARIRFLRDLIYPLMAVIKATPVASFIILMLIFIGSAKVPTLITAMIVLPVVWGNLDEGFSRVDRGLFEVCRVFRMSPARRFRLLTFPALLPYFLSAMRTSIGLAWKAGVAAEIIASPRDSIGTMIGDAKNYLITEDMFAWTLTVICLSIAIELLFTFLFEKLTNIMKKGGRSAC